MQLKLCPNIPGARPHGCADTPLLVLSGFRAGQETLQVLLEMNQLSSLHSRSLFIIKCKAAAIYHYPHPQPSSPRAIGRGWEDIYSQLFDFSYLTEPIKSCFSEDNASLSGLAIPGRQEAELTMDFDQACACRSQPPRQQAASEDSRPLPAQHPAPCSPPFTHRHHRLGVPQGLVCRHQGCRFKTFCLLLAL